MLRRAPPWCPAGPPDEGNAGPGVHQSSARLTIQFAVHVESLGVSKAAHQGASALEGVMGLAAGSPTAAGSEAWVRAPDSPGRGDQARDSGWYAVVVAGPGEQRVAPGGRAPHPRRLRPSSPGCSGVRVGRGSMSGGGSAEEDRLIPLRLL